MWHKPCRTFNPWCLCIKTRCLSNLCWRWPIVGYVSPTPNRRWANRGYYHWSRVTHICVSNLTIIGSGNGLSPGRHQAIILANDGILVIGPLGTNICEILIAIYTYSFKKMHLKMSSGKWWPFCPGLKWNVLLKHAIKYCNCWNGC